MTPHAGRSDDPSRSSDRRRRPRAPAGRLALGLQEGSFHPQEDEMNRTDARSVGAGEPERGGGSVNRAIAASRRIAWIVMVVADVGLLAWAAMAALAPELLVGPR